MNISFPGVALSRSRPGRIAKRSGSPRRFARQRRIELERLEPRLALSAAAAHLLSDIAPGSASSAPRDFTESNGAIYFLADSSGQSSALWTTDAQNQTAAVHQQTSSGTVQLQGLYAYQNQLVFLKSELVQGAGGYDLELWASQGTSQSTALVRDFGTKSGQLSNQPDVTQDPYFGSVAGRLLASIDGRNSRGRELWTSNLTSSGTSMLKDIDSGANSSTPNSWIAFGGRVYFSASNAQSGEELWSSDGVATQLVQDFMPGSEGSYPSGLLVADGSLYFATHHLGADGVYSSDDVMKWWRIADPNASPILIHDFGPGSGASLIKTQLAYFQGQLYGVAQDPQHGVELWRTDGSAAGASLLLDLNPHGDALPWQPTATFDALFFSADDGVHGEELWKIDGTPGGTVLVRDINTGGSSGPTSLVAKDGELFFSADDGTGRSLWQSDGTADGTLRVPSQNSGVNGSDPRDLTILGSNLYYSASTAAAGREPWAARIYSWHAASLSVDVNRDAHVVPGDVLIVINELNNHRFSDASTGLLPENRPDVANAYHYDVNADGYASPNDALRIINCLNDPGCSNGSSGDGEGEGEPAAAVIGVLAPSWPASRTPAASAAPHQSRPSAEPSLVGRSSSATPDHTGPPDAASDWSRPRADSWPASPFLRRRSAGRQDHEAAVDRVLAADDWWRATPERKSRSL